MYIIYEIYLNVRKPYNKHRNGLARVGDQKSYINFIYMNNNINTFTHRNSFSQILLRTISTKLLFIDYFVQNFICNPTFYIQLNNKKYVQQDIYNLTTRNQGSMGSVPPLYLSQAEA